MDLDCSELEQESFNSLYSCKYLKNTNFPTKKDKNIFHYTPINNRKDEKASSADANNFLESFTLQLNFDYFQTHDFHQLIRKKQAQNSFSILHTDICSLHANVEDLETLINNLEHNFSVVALSETWTSKQEINKPFPELKNYQPFYATQGTTTKSGCGFYVRKGLKFKSGRDLDLTYHNDENEFQSCQIEILNEKEPNTIIGVYCRHAKKNSNDIFNIKLDGTIKKFKDSNKIKIICGDFNYNLLNHECKADMKNTFVCDPPAW